MNANGTVSNGTAQHGAELTQQAAIEDMRRSILRYNDLQSVLNEDLFGPLQNDSVIIVVQVWHMQFPLFNFRINS